MLSLNHLKNSEMKQFLLISATVVLLTLFLKRLVKSEVIQSIIWDYLPESQRIKYNNNYLSDGPVYAPAGTYPCIMSGYHVTFNAQGKDYSFKTKDVGIRGTSKGTVTIAIDGLAAVTTLT